MKSNRNQFDAIQLFGIPSCGMLQLQDFACGTLCVTSLLAKSCHSSKAQIFSSFELSKFRASDSSWLHFGCCAGGSKTILPLPNQILSKWQSRFQPLSRFGHDFGRLRKEVLPRQTATAPFLVSMNPKPYVLRHAL